jgi:hypothetical protein
MSAGVGAASDLRTLDGAGIPSAVFFLLLPIAAGS